MKSVRLNKEWFSPANLAIAGSVGVAGLSFSLSFTALTELSVEHYVPEGQAWMVPFAVDGLVIVSTIASAAAKKRSRRIYAWVLLLLGTMLSVAGNVTHAWLLSGGNPIACGIAAMPPLVQLAVWHLTMMLWEEKAETEAETVVEVEETESTPELVAV
ncbi:putative excisionase [Rhodococcus phage RGL3]|uniref:Putative excisionase n=1 Tax=Rhodococcus phage RGL3 TaxID=2922221 RepID=G9FHL5_9CAUD|nr:excisionase [Rhodococcus phage RGL3]AEV52103.1 putative excisionase [Rhodococcus phage RGL3]